MDATSSRLCMSAAPKVSAQAHDCGQPQFMSTPLTWGASSFVVRDISSGELTPSWRMVGGGERSVVKSKKLVRNVLIHIDFVGRRKLNDPMPTGD